MINPAHIPYAKVAKIAKDGSPLLLQALGRLYGLGPRERSAFGQNGGGVPGWAWGTLVLVAGVFIGVKVQKYYPQFVPNMVAGEDD